MIEDAKNHQGKLEIIESLMPKGTPDLTSPEALAYKKSLVIFPEEAVYVMSFKENKMIYAAGWENLLGYKDEEMTIMKVLESNTGQYRAFAADFNAKAVMYTLSLTERHTEYSFVMEVKKKHKDGHLVPVISRVGILEAENGKATKIIGRFQINRSLKFGKVITFSTYGPNAEEFHEMLNEELFQYVTVSEKEKEALSLVAQGYSFKEIASIVGISQSAVEKRIIPLYKRFDVKSISHLIAFCYENNIL